MKKIAFLGLILFYVLSALAQESDKAGNNQQKNQVQTREQTTSRSSVQKSMPAGGNQQNFTADQQALTAPQRVPVKIVRNTRSGDKKVRVKFGSANDSGPKLILEKKNVKSKCTPAELQRVLGDSKKMKPVRIAADQK